MPDTSHLALGFHSPRLQPHLDAAAKVIFRKQNLIMWLLCLESLSSGSSGKSFLEYTRFFIIRPLTTFPASSEVVAHTSHTRPTEQLGSSQTVLLCLPRMQFSHSPLRQTPTHLVQPSSKFRVHHTFLWVTIAFYTSPYDNTYSTWRHYLFICLSLP